MVKNIILELLKLEYVNLNNGFIISDIIYIEGRYLVNLEHVFTKSNISLSFIDEYDLLNYLLYEIYDITIEELISLDKETITFLEQFENEYDYDDESLKNHILYKIYNKYKNIKISDNIVINKQLDEIEYDENVEYNLYDINRFEEPTKYYTQSNIYKLNKGGNKHLLNYELDYNLSFLDDYNLKNNIKLSNINVMIKDVEIFKMDKIYRINLDLIVIEDNSKMFNVKINNFDSFEESNITQNIYRILDLNKKSFKLQVHNKLRNLKFYNISNDITGETLSFYDYKHNIIEKILNIENVYLGFDDRVIDKSKCESLLYEYFIRSGSSIINVDIFREYLLLNLGLNLNTYSNFLKLSEEVIDEHLTRIEKLKKYNN